MFRNSWIPNSRKSKVTFPLNTSRPAAAKVAGDKEKETDSSSDVHKKHVVITIKS